MTRGTKFTLQTAIDAAETGSVKQNSDKKKKKDYRSKEARDRREEKAPEEIKDEKLSLKEAEELAKKLESQRGVA